MDEARCQRCRARAPAILELPLTGAVRIPGKREYTIQAGEETVHTILALGNRVVPIFGMSANDVKNPEQFTEILLDAVLTDFTLPSTRTTVLLDGMTGNEAKSTRSTASSRTSRGGSGVVPRRTRSC